MVFLPILVKTNANAPPIFSINLEIQIIKYNPPKTDGTISNLFEKNAILKSQIKEYLQVIIIKNAISIIPIRKAMLSLLNNFSRILLFAQKYPKPKQNMPNKVVNTIQHPPNKLHLFVQNSQLNK